jgi:ABC-type Zn uptake system ZnuABC Zn-binding protein ZnuA
MRRPIATAIALLALLAGCGDDDDGGSGGAEVSVVATTTQVADMAREVGGPRVDVRGLLPAGADPHDFEPRPSDVASIAEADVVLRSGGEVDEWLGALVEDAGGQTETVELIDSVERRGEDPHWWQDPRNGILAVEAIRDALAEADPSGRDGYERRAAAYVRRLRELDRSIAACMERVPEAKRKLVTTHDALGYFADRYDVEVVGELIPSLSSQAQPSVGEVDELVDRIRAEDVEAIFPESGLNAKLEQAVSRDAGVEVGGELWADSLGPEGSSGDTYAGSLAANAETMASGMSGGRVSCAG